MVESLIHHMHTILTFAYIFQEYLKKKWQKIQAVTPLGKLSIFESVTKIILDSEIKKDFFLMIF